MHKNNFSLPPNEELSNNFLVKVLQAITGKTLSGYPLYVINALGAGILYGVWMFSVALLANGIIYFDHKNLTLLKYFEDSANWFIYAFIAWSQLEFFTLVFPFWIQWALKYHEIKTITFAVFISIGGFVFCVLLLGTGIPSSWFFAS